MKSFVVLIVLSTNSIFFSTVNSLECQYCSDGKYSSDCRKGTVKELKTCTIVGEDHCYTEYILNEGEKPFYRRGCAPGNWCQQQDGYHGTALKYCNTCQGSNCNNDTIGAKDESTFLCLSCDSEDLNGDCRKGKDKTTEECEKGDVCIQWYVSTTMRNHWKRECGDKDACTQIQNKYGGALDLCQQCKYELCNNYPMSISYN